MSYTPERTSALQNQQYGIEATPGAGATATVKLVGITIKPTPKVNTHKFTAQGNLFPSLITLGKDYTEAKIDASPIYEEMDFLLASCLGTPSTGVYSPSNDASNTPQTYDIEIGNSGLCEEFKNAVVTGFNFKWNRDKIDLSADMIGDKLIGGTWSTSAAAPSTVTPILPEQVTIKQAGTTMTRCFSAELAVSGRWKPVWTLDATKTSFVSLVECAPDATIKLKVEADAAGIAHLTRLRAGNATVAFEIGAVSGGLSLTFLAATKVQDVEAFEDEDGVYAVGYTLGVVYDPSLDYSLKATLDTTA